MKVYEIAKTRLYFSFVVLASQPNKHILVYFYLFYILEDYTTRSIPWPSEEVRTVVVNTLLLLSNYVIGDDNF